MPKGIRMLVNAALKQINEDNIDAIITQTLDFLSDAYVHIEKINNEDSITLDDSVEQARLTA